MKFLIILWTVMNMSLTGLNSVGNSVNTENGTGDIIVEINNIQDIKGEIYLGLYNKKKTFRKYKKVYRTEMVSVEGEVATLVIKDVPYNTYAIALFQDFNGNQRLDKSFVGAPKEPFGFSRNFKVKRKGPKFKQATFGHGEEETVIKISLQKFKW